MADAADPAQILQRAIGLPPLIAEEKLDFLLGLIQDGPAAVKAAQRGHDFTQRLGFDRARLRTVLKQQVTDPGLADRVVSARANPFGGPLLNLRTHVVGPSGTSATLMSSWEVADTHLRLVTAWAEIYRPDAEEN